MARTGKAPWLVILLVVGGLAVVGCAGAVGIVLLVGMNVTTSDPPSTVTVTRDEFRKSVVGKTEKEVLDLHGKPDSTTDSGGLRLWTYSRRTHDPVTGKTDSQVAVFFRDGKVESVDY